MKRRGRLQISLLNYEFMSVLTLRAALAPPKRSRVEVLQECAGWMHSWLQQYRTAGCTASCTSDMEDKLRSKEEVKEKKFSLTYPETIRAVVVDRSREVTALGKKAPY